MRARNPAGLAVPMGSARPVAGLARAILQHHELRVVRGLRQVHPADFRSQSRLELLYFHCATHIFRCRSATVYSSGLTLVSI